MISGKIAITALLGATFLTIATLPFCTPACAADNADASTPATGEPLERSSFTLLNPTPTTDLREIDTDRPNKTNSPHTIDAGHLQIEFGLFDYLYNRNRYHGADARTDAIALGQFNFRLGVLYNVEFNAVIDAWHFQRDKDDISRQSSRQNTFGDAIVGGKINFWGNNNANEVWDTALGMQPQFKIPTAREPSGNGRPEMLVGFPLAINLPGSVLLTVQTSPGWERNSTNSGYVTGWQNSVSLDREIFENLDAYIEYWSHVTTERHQEAQQTLDVGCLYQLTRNFVLDTGVSVGLNHASPSVEWVVGGSVRF